MGLHPAQTTGCASLRSVISLMTSQVVLVGDWRFLSSVNAPRPLRWHLNTSQRPPKHGDETHVLHDSCLCEVKSQRCWLDPEDGFWFLRLKTQRCRSLIGQHSWRRNEFIIRNIWTNIRTSSFRSWSWTAGLHRPTLSSTVRRSLLSSLQPLSCSPDLFTHKTRLPHVLALRRALDLTQMWDDVWTSPWQEMGKD